MGTVNKTTDELNQFIEDTEVFMEESPGKKAAATGAEVFNDYSANKATGTYSHAENYGNTASGNQSHAEGTRTTASGESSHSEGSGTKAGGVNSHAEGTQTVAGPYSHAEGNLTDASGDTAHAEGYKSKAFGQFSHAEGSDCTCESGAPRSHAEGFNTKTSAPNSHAEGNGSHVLQNGDCGHCEGSGTWVWSFAGHAEGNQTQAWDTAHAEGYLCQAQGTLSHAGGYGSHATGYASFAHGLAVSTTLDYEVSFGQYNATGPRTAFSIGVGTGEDARKNALEVSTSGNTYLYGVGGYDGTNADTAVPINQLDRPTRSTANMNDCLQTGFYPWCTLGRPTGATGAFSLAVRRASTPDYQGYYTVEQTCYGREAEQGQVWTRMVFDKGGSASPDTDYMEWIRVDGGVGQEGGMDPVTVRLSCGGDLKANLSRDLAVGESIAIFRRTRMNYYSDSGGAYKYTYLATDHDVFDENDNIASGLNLWDTMAGEKNSLFRSIRWNKVPMDEVPDHEGIAYIMCDTESPEDTLGPEVFGAPFVRKVEKSPSYHRLCDGRGVKIGGKYKAYAHIRFAVGVVKMTTSKECRLVSNLAKFKLRYESNGDTVSIRAQAE